MHSENLIMKDKCEKNKNFTATKNFKKLILQIF